MIRWRPYDFAVNFDGLIGAIVGVSESDMHYEVEPVNEQYFAWFWARNKAGYIRSDCTVHMYEEVSPFDTPEEAKALCQRHYNLLILQ